MARNRMSLDEQISLLRMEFLGSLTETLDQIELEVLKFDGKTWADLEVDELVREIHSIKGAGGTYGLQIITDICHVFEDRIDHLSQSGEVVTELETNNFLAVIDKLRNVVTIQTAGGSTENLKQKMGEIWAATILLREPPKKMSVMIVDNSRSLPKMIESALAEADIAVEVDFYTDGYLALGRLVSKPYEILITGNTLTHLSGSGLISAIKLSANLPNLTTALVIADKKSTNDVPSYVAADVILTKSKSLVSDIVRLIQGHIEENKSN